MTSKINKSHLILLKIIEKNGNKNCADCGVEGTRWASWNFGIFLCIRCAGIHRNLGVHISKVKSVDLDSWTSEQLQVMEEIGNRKSQQIYEAALPEHFIRPQTNYAIEEFIRAKYQHKRYCIDTPPPSAKPVNTPEVVVDQCNEPTDRNRIVDNSVKPIAKSETISPDSDDSLSDPEYLIDLKEKLKKPCHKVHSDGDLINFHSSSKSIGCSSVGGSESAKSDNKTQILSLYNQSKLHGGYQSSLPANSAPFHHRTYGSSVDTQFYCMTGIPASSQNSYLKQIQDKISVIKDNLTSKFRQYEQPNHTSSPSMNVTSQRSSKVPSPDSINHNGGQTLSPDLWR